MAAQNDAKIIDLTGLEHYHKKLKFLLENEYAKKNEIDNMETISNDDIDNLFN